MLLLAFRTKDEFAWAAPLARTSEAITSGEDELKTVEVTSM